MRGTLRGHDFQHCHDIGNGGLVIRTEHAGSVGENDLLPLVGQEFGMLRHPQPDIPLRIEADIPAVKTLYPGMYFR